MGGGEVLAERADSEGIEMRLTYEDLVTLRLALENWITEETEGATTSQDELDDAQKLWQKLTREAINRREKESK